MSADTSRHGAQGIASLVAGALFGFGLALGGMTDPTRVRGFLDFFGHWDPTLAFVMAGAVTVHTLSLRLITRRSSPVLAPRFALPTRRDIDARLVVGAAVFGLGWGLGGFCPGPGLASIVAARGAAVVFVLAMLAGSSLAARLEEARSPALDVAPARASALKHP